MVKNLRKSKKLPNISKKTFRIWRETKNCIFFWCDLEANREVLKKPFKIIISFDNPVAIAKFFKKRCEKSFPFDFTIYDNIVWGLTNKYDIHNVAMEAARIREQLEKLLANR